MPWDDDLFNIPFDALMGDTVKLSSEEPEPIKIKPFIQSINRCYICNYHYEDPADIKDMLSLDQTYAIRVHLSCYERHIKGKVLDC